MLPITDIAKSFGRTVVDNSPAILTAAAVTGVATTAILTGRAAYKSAEMLAGEGYWNRDYAFEMSTKDKAKKYWKLYIPAAITGTATIVFVLGANHVSSRRNAAILSAYSLADTAFKEYKDKVVEQIGSNKEQKVRDAVAQDRVTNNPPSREVIIATGAGESLFLESISGRYFTSDLQKVRKAIVDINFQILDEMYASQNDLYRMIGIPTTAFGDDMGWNVNAKLEVDFTTAVSDDERACFVLNYRPMPFPQYHKAF